MKFKALTLLSSALLMSGCLFDESVTSAIDESKEKSTITMKITDSQTGLPVDSAKVFSELSKDTLYSDSLGVVTWTKNVIGDYSYIVSKDGYASSKVKAEVVETGKGDAARVPDKIVEVGLHTIGASVSGTILLKETESENLNAASKIPVVIKYIDGDIYPSEVETTTNGSGVFTFDSLAANTSYQIVIPQATIDDQVYKAVDADSIVVRNLRAGESHSLNMITMEVVGLLPELIRSNFNELDTIDEGSYIKLTFSTSMIKDSVPTAWTVMKYGYPNDDGSSCLDGTKVLTAAALDKDGKTVIINSVSNKWNRVDYCLEGTVYTKEGRSKKFALSFNPGSLSERPSNLKKLTVDDTDFPKLTLSWKAPSEDISGYKVFYRTNRMADALELADIDNPNAKVYEVNTNSSRFEDAKYVVFYVLPYATINGKDITSDPSDDELVSKKIILDDAL